MSAELMAGLVVFSFVSSITPGPNNLMLMASGVNFGFRRSIPHMLGIAAGFAVLLLAVGAGLGTVIEAYPGLALAMKFASAAYLIYLAWKIATARGIGGGGAAAEPLGVWPAAAFQWVNTKAWAKGLVGMAAYVDLAQPWASIALVTIVFTLVSMPSISVWAGFGIALRGFLSVPSRLRGFNIAMGLLLVATLWPMLG